MLLLVYFYNLPISFIVYRFISNLYTFETFSRFKTTNLDVELILVRGEGCQVFGVAYRLRRFIGRQADLAMEMDTILFCGVCRVRGGGGA